MTSQPGQQAIALHTLTSISQCKCNQTMKLGQLIEVKANGLTVSFNIIGLQ